MIISILLSLFPATCIKGESFTQAPSMKPGKIFLQDFPASFKGGKEWAKKGDTGAR